MCFIFNKINKRIALSIAFMGFSQLFGQKPDLKSMERMKADVSYLASDALQGRLTGSAGELLSSQYIADLYKAHKLKALNENGSYFQEFTIVRARITQSSAPLSFRYNKNTMQSLATYTGYYPLSPSCNDCKASGDVYFAGYGIKAPELNYNDYKDSTSCAGKIFVILLGDPDGNNPHSKFEAYSDIHTKTELALKYGAKGVVFVRKNENDEKPSGQLSTKKAAANIPVLFALDSLVKKAEYIDMSAKIAVVENTAHNVIGFINNKKKTTIIIGAHQDHLGYNELGGSRTKDEGKIHNGADDNASGVAVMLELMRTLSKKKFKNHNYLFIAFSGEEQGLLGSNYYTKHPLIPNDKICYMLNFDMLGRLDSTKRKLIVYGVGTSPEWKTAMEQIPVDTNILRLKTTESGTGSSDHTSFYYQNIPVLHFFTGQHKDYHMPSDDEEYINYEGMWQCYNYVYQLIGKLDKKTSIPFTPTKNDEETRVSFKVTLGIMPDYAFDGHGMRVDGVNQGRPGEQAGLKAGDIIVQMGNVPVDNVQDYMKALSGFKKGDTTTIKIMRTGAEQQLTVIF